MSFKDFTPEQRRANAEKAAATRRAKAAAKRQEAVDGGLPDTQEAPTLADLGLKVEDDGSYWESEILTEAEKDAIRAAERKRIHDEERAAARKAFVEEIRQQVRREAGTIPVSEEDKAYREELVQVRVQMPALRKPTGGEQAPEPILLDGRVYVSGRTYTVERQVAVFLVSIMDQNRRMVNQADGRSRAYYAERAGTMIYQGGLAQGGGMGPSFDAIHRRPA
jgi:hypothetical protein